MSFNHVEAGKVAVGRNHISAEGHEGTVDAGRGIRCEVNTAPQAHTRCAAGTDFVRAQTVVVVRVKRTTGTIAIVEAGRDNDLATGHSFGNQLGTHADFDACTFQLQDHVRINHEAGVEASPIAACERQVEDSCQCRSVIREGGG